MILSCPDSTGISTARYPVGRLFLWLPPTDRNINGIQRRKEIEQTANEELEGDGREIALFVMIN